LGRSEFDGQGSRQFETREKVRGTQFSGDGGLITENRLGTHFEKDFRLQEDQGKEIKCFRCTQSGHHQSECSNEPLCYKCKGFGHMAAECHIQRKMRLFGFGMPEQGFFGIDISENKEQMAGLVASIHVLEGEPDEEKLEEELKNLVQENWEFRVRRVDKFDFIASFTDKGSLENYAKLNSLEMPIYRFRVKIGKTSVDPKASAELQSVWVKIFNIPEKAREKIIVKEVASLVGKPVIVDELSLIKDGPVRVQVLCRDPSRIRGLVEVFFNKTGYELKFLVEGKHRKAAAAGGYITKGDSGEEDHNRDRDKAGRKDGKRGGGKFDRKGKEIERNQESSHGDSHEEENTECMEVDTHDCLLAGFHPMEGFSNTINEGLGGQTGGADISFDHDDQLVLKKKMKEHALEDNPMVLLDSQQSDIVDQEEEKGKIAKELAHFGGVIGGLDGEILDFPGGEDMEAALEVDKQNNAEGDANRFKMVNYSSREGNEEQQICMVNCGGETLAVEEEGSKWDVVVNKRGRKKTTTKGPVRATRASSRIPRDGIPILEKATRRALEKDITQGTSSSNTFTILNQERNENLAAVLKDIGIELDNYEDQIDAFKEEEKLRAAIAEANYKAHIEKINNRNAPQTEEEIQEYAMEAITNSDRNGEWEGAQDGPVVPVTQKGKRKRRPPKPSNTINEVLGPCFVAPKVLREEAASAEIVPRKWPKVPFYRASALQTDIKIE
jgi:hypothetical protein